jgi:hypothetical protein
MGKKLYVGNLLRSAVHTDSRRRHRCLSCRPAGDVARRPSTEWIVGPGRSVTHRALPRTGRTEPSYNNSKTYGHYGTMARTDVARRLPQCNHLPRKTAGGAVASLRAVSAQVVRVRP